MKMEILAEFPVPCDQSIVVVKGKRTKRPRPSSSADDSHNSHAYSSPATSTASTEEDEDMANCLILLARGDDNSTRKFAQMPTTTDARVGIYVYECKTCNRTFPSFQALGGHRASHKRPKLHLASDQELSGHDCSRLPPNKISSHDHHESNKLPKTHECSICKSEFASGQALGGHMRRHRAVEKPRNVLALDLDLNLPAPVEVDDKYSQQPRSTIVFSAAALVDCHY